MASYRSTVLVVDKQGTVCDQISKELRNLGYHDLCVEDMGSLGPLLDSRDRIYTVVLADSGSSVKDLKAKLMALKQFAADAPIIFTTENNEPRKEKEMRQVGVFFYHVMGDGVNSLIEAIHAAMEVAIRDELFVSAIES